jgi:hypothetical protein
MGSPLLGLSIFLLLALGPCLSCPLHAEGSQPSTVDRGTQFLYREFRDVKSFGIIAVALVGQAEELGLRSDEITARARARFREYFPNIPLEDVSGDSKRFLDLVFSRDKTVGSITFRIWVLGEELPVVYHVKCDAGTFDNPAIWTDETLGHTSRASLRETVDGMVDEMLKTLAVAFLKVRAQKI